MTEAYLIRCSALSGFDRLVESLGGDPKEILKRYGLSIHDLTSELKTMRIQDMVILLEQCAQQLSCPDFGLRLGAAQDVTMLGPLGLVLKNSGTPREALHAVRGLMSFHNQSEYWDYHEHKQNVIIQRYENFHDISDTRQYKELALSACYQLCNIIIGPSFEGVRLEFSHAPVASLPVYHQYFKMDVKFNQEQDAIIIQRKYLDQAIHDSNNAIRMIATNYLQNLNTLMAHDIRLQVSTLIQQTLGMQEHTIENIAQLMHMNKRTLQRRLKDNDIVFKELLNDIRMKSACWHLKSSNMDITLLSEMLGYSDVSCFSRAFKKSMKVAPLKWRAYAKDQRSVL